MRYLGLDLGDRSLGLAISDPLGIIASPLKTLFYEGDYNELLADLKSLLKEKKIDAFILGLPKNMNNSEGPRAEKSREFKAFLEENLKVKVILEDERLSTKGAEKALIEGDVSRSKRKEKIDSVAASIILQNYLNRI